MNDKLKEEIISILISVQETVKLGSDGEYEQCPAVLADSFDTVADKIGILIQAISDPENQPNQYGIKLYPESLPEGDGWMQDKNFTVRLQAAVDKRMKDAGIFDAMLSKAKDYDVYKEQQRKFFDSLVDITIGYLQGTSSTINK